MVRQVSDDPPPMTRVGAAVASVVLAGLAKDPARRPPALELAGQLERAVRQVDPR